MALTESAEVCAVAAGGRRRPSAALRTIAPAPEDLVFLRHYTPARRRQAQPAP